ncbi:DUF2169 domain-containing protein [Sorangium sp. So ce233]|uniref:DUF2169 family type VI secretion system accessory protein n=1 Tax=Sorangium sp. So ce233 TaxID=3133290 RepID=UPI003F62667D
MQGAERLTVIVKATFTLVHERCAELAAAADLVRADQPREGWGSLDEACETAPYLPSAGVLVRGHASAPAGETATSLSVRVALFRDDRWILNKVLHVFGDYTRAALSPRPFSRVPIVYERAYGGPHVDANPVGVGADTVLPSIVDPTDPTRPAGFGPIARHWAPRRHLLARDQAPDRPVPELDASFDFRYFHAAPPDQQLEFLRGDEWIFLEGLHPHYPWLRSSLPSARGLARLYRAGAGGEDHGQPIELVADTLSIDADRLLCSLIWRGNVALQPGDTPARMRVVAGVELPGRPLVWPTPLAGPPSSRSSPEAPGFVEEDPESARRPVIQDEITAETHVADLVAGVGQPLAPFALAEPGSGPPTRGSTIPGAPWSTRSRATPLRPPPRAVSHFTPEIEAALTGVSSLLAPWADAHTTDGQDPAPSSQVLPFTPASPPSGELPPGSVPFAMPFARPGSDPLLRLDERAAPPVSSPEALDGQSPAIAPPFVHEPAPAPASTRAAPASGVVPVAPASTRSAPASTRAALANGAAPASARAIPAAPAAPSSEPEARGLRAALLARLRNGQPLNDLELAGVELDGVDFSGASLERLNLAGSTLTRCNFASARLAGVNMSGADLTDASFHAADLTRADLSRATLDRAQLSSALLSHADLAFARGSHARFEGASLEGADLRQARLTDSVFDRAILADVNGSKADISRSSFVSANLAGAILRSAKLKEARLPCANLDGVDLRDADLAGANVYGVKLANAKSSGAILRSLVEIPPADDGINGSSGG